MKKTESSINVKNSSMSVNPNQSKSEQAKKSLYLSVFINSYNEKFITISLTNFIFFIRLEIITSVYFFILRSIPDYSKAKDDIPNNYDPDEDNNPMLDLTFQIINSKICFPSDFASKSNLITLKTDVWLKIKKHCLRGIKDKLIDNYETIMQEKDKYNFEKIDAGKLGEVLLKEEVSDKTPNPNETTTNVKWLKLALFEVDIEVSNSFLMICDINSIEDGKYKDIIILKMRDNRKMVVNSLSQIVYKSVLQIQKLGHYVKTTEINVVVDKSMFLFTYQVKINNFIIFNL